MYYKYALVLGVGGQSEVAKEAKFGPPRSKGQHHPLPCFVDLRASGSVSLFFSAQSSWTPEHANNHLIDGLHYYPPLNTAGTISLA